MQLDWSRWRVEVVAGPGGRSRARLQAGGRSRRRGGPTGHRRCSRRRSRAPRRSRRLARHRRRRRRRRQRPHRLMSCGLPRRRLTTARALVQAGADPWRSDERELVMPANLCLAGPTPARSLRLGDAELSPDEAAAVALSRDLIAALGRRHRGRRSQHRLRRSATAAEAVLRLGGSRWSPRRRCADAGRPLRLLGRRALRMGLRRHRRWSAACGSCNPSGFNSYCSGPPWRR